MMQLGRKYPMLKDLQALNLSMSYRGESQPKPRQLTIVYKLIIYSGT